MSPRFERQLLGDGSFFEGTVDHIVPDEWRPHGVRYRIAWIQGGVCRVLFDNHHGKSDHCHVDGVERDYKFSTFDELMKDFMEEVRKLGGRI